MTAKVKMGALKKVTLKTGAIAAALGLMSTQALAISDGIRSNREAECAIWLCLPGGFGEGCSAAREAYYKRIHDLNWKGQRKYTDVPSMSVCHDDNPEGIEDTHLEEESAIGYRKRYEVTVPESYRCTGWRLLRRGDGSEQISVCASVESIPGRQFISESNEHFYETINLGDEHSRTLRAPARQYAEVLVDGQSVGQRYYAD